MIRREFLKTIPVMAGLRGWAAERRMNIVFMVADDMNSALGCFGHPIVKTPNLDRLAARSVAFERAYCQFPLCAPSRTSFLSGRRPETTRVLSLTVPTRKYLQDAVMLPEFFRKNGYFSADCGKIYHTGPEHDDPRSWDFVLKESGKNPPDSEVIEHHEASKPRNHTMEWSKLRTADESTPDGIVVHTAVAKIRESVARNQPLFAGVGFRRPHSPYAVPKKYFDLYDPRKIPLPEAGDHRLLPEAAWYELANQPPLKEKEQREYIAAYYACNSFVDAQAGVVFAALDELKLWDRTIVVFFGDHGYHNGEHGMWHKMTLFEASARVPLLIHVPGAKGSGRKCRGIVELLDLYPTLVEACGFSPPPGLEGKSLMSLMNDPSGPGKQAAFTMVGRNEDRTLSHRQPSYFGKSVRTDRWRYTEWDDGRKGAELYDEQKDPQETRNLVADPHYKSTVTGMKALLRSATT